MNPMQPMKPMEPMQPMKPIGGDSWWPKDLGRPTTSGTQNGSRYAFFPDKHRLLIERGGRLSTYDSGEHLISGVSQAGGDDQSPTFTSQVGSVKLEELKKLV
jgi:hypothetical protein